MERRSFLLALLALAGCKDADDETSSSEPPTETSAQPKQQVPKATTPNDFYARGLPTFVVGTAGDEMADRGVAGQVKLVRGMAFPTAKAVDDVDVDTAKWPANPVLYGGEHVNALVKELGPGWGVRVDADRIRIGGETFEGAGMRFIGVVPQCDKHPELLLYAGTGVLGTAEINSVSHGKTPFVVADRFGALVTGRWKDATTAVLDDERAHRIPWRAVKRDVGGAAVAFYFPSKLPAPDDEAALIDAGARGLARAIERLKVEAPPPMHLYVYPDLGSIRSITGKAGAGHAIPSALTLHVVQVPADRREQFEHLVAHEGTHLLTAHAWGPASTPLLGEGVAVWASGFYAGQALEGWKKSISGELTVERALSNFRKLPEKETYPFAGLLVEAAVAAVGVEKVRDHLYAAAPSEWAAACKRAGTTAEALEKTIR